VQVKTFYRVNHKTTKQGLWYDFAGGFTGLIHNEFSFCQNRELRMDFDPEIVGYMSVVETLPQLCVWFTPSDILRLQTVGYYAHEYQSADYKWYPRFGHYVMNQANFKLVRRIVLHSATGAESTLPCSVPQNRYLFCGTEGQ
jgi:hypothetical protein